MTVPLKYLQSLDDQRTPEILSKETETLRQVSQIQN